MNLITLNEAALATEAQIDAMLEESVGEITPEIEALMDELIASTDAVNSKIDAYGHVIDRATKDAATIKERMAHLAARRKAAESKVRGLKQRMQYMMQQRGVNKIEGKYYTFARQNNGGQLPLLVDEVDPLELDDRFQTTTVALDKSEVRRALDAGEEIEWARYGERGESIRLR